MSPYCNDCRKSFNNVKAHRASCIRKDITCRYPTDDPTQFYSVILHRQGDQKFACLLCDQRYMKAQNMQSHTKTCKATPLTNVQHSSTTLAQPPILRLTPQLELTFLPVPAKRPREGHRIEHEGDSDKENGYLDKGDSDDNQSDQSLVQPPGRRRRILRYISPSDSSEPECLLNDLSNDAMDFSEPERQTLSGLTNVYGTIRNVDDMKDSGGQNVNDAEPPKGQVALAHVLPDSQDVPASTPPLAPTSPPASIPPCASSAQSGSAVWKMKGFSGQTRRSHEGESADPCWSGTAAVLTDSKISGFTAPGLGHDEDPSSDEDSLPSADKYLDEDYRDFFDDEVDAQLYAEDPLLQQRSGATSSGNTVTAPSMGPPRECNTLPADSDPQSNTSATRHIQHSDRLDPVIPAPTPASKKACIYNGTTCTCTTDDHQQDPSLPPSSLQHIDTSCRILQALRLSFHRYHQFLICQCYGGSFVALNDLKSHIKQKHPTQLRGSDIKTARSDFPRVIDHIATSFNLPSKQEAVLFTEETFAGPIAGIARPAKYFVCPSCGSYCQSKKSMVRHFCKSCHKKTGMSLDVDSLSTQWTQYPFAVLGVHSKRVRVNGPLNALLNPDAASSDPNNETLQLRIERYEVPKGLTAVVPSWLNNLGWTAWRNRLLTGLVTLSVLYGLTVLPKRPLGAQLSTPLSSRAVLYFAKCRIHARLTAMLEDANVWLSGASSELRSQLTMGTKSTYRAISKSSYKHYASEFTRVVLALARIKKLEDDISTLLIRRNMRQDNAISAFTQFIFDGTLAPPHDKEASPDYDGHLDLVLFALLEALFYQKLDPIHADGYPTDFVMMLVWLCPDGSHIPPSRITHLCTIAQYWAVTDVIFHSFSMLVIIA